MRYSLILKEPRNSKVNQIKNIPRDDYNASRDPSELSATGS